MPFAEVFIVVQWWVALLLVGLSAYPFTKLLFPTWFDHGYLFSKAVGLAMVTWVVYIFGITHLVPFTMLSIILALVIVYVGGSYLHKSPLTHTSKWSHVVFEEIFFFLALLLWSWVKAHEPSLRGLEKFMDYGFMNSILHSIYFPPIDMWYPPYPINYYYFGHMATAVLTRLSGLDLAVTFNLTLATIFAFCFTMSYSIGYELIKNKWAAIVTAYLVTLAGNMQTLYAFTRGYTGEDVKPFWQLLWPAREFFTRLPEGLTTYWYANATRFIPYTIHEFPSYSFVVSDIHGHVLSIPFVLLAMGLLIQLFTAKKNDVLLYVFYGFLMGVLLMTNALDGPIYFGLFVVIYIIFNWSHIANKSTWVNIVVVLSAAVVASLPFLSHFKSFVNGVAVNCPPAALANSKYGPLLFETVDKCQKSPFWMMYLLWGLFWFCGIWWIGSKWKKQFTAAEKLLSVFFVYSVLLIIFPEFLYFKDIYPQHFRSNTMFKLGYQAFMMFTFVSVYAIYYRALWKKTLFLVLLAPQLFLVIIYPFFSVRSYFGGLKNYESIQGLAFLEREYPDDYQAVQWFNTKRLPYTINPDRTTIVEADGDSYTDYQRFSVFTGIPTVIGWSVHEWLWRGSYDVVAPRKEDVRLIYESTSESVTRALLDQYHVAYVIVGALERKKFTDLFERKFESLGKPVFTSGQTVVYEIGY